MSAEEPDKTSPPPVEWEDDTVANAISHMSILERAETAQRIRSNLPKGGSVRDLGRRRVDALVESGVFHVHDLRPRSRRHAPASASELRCPTCRAAYHAEDDQ